MFPGVALLKIETTFVTGKRLQYSPDFGRLLLEHFLHIVFIVATAEILRDKWTCKKSNYNSR